MECLLEIPYYREIDGIGLQGTGVSAFAHFYVPYGYG